MKTATKLTFASVGSIIAIVALVQAQGILALDEKLRSCGALRPGNKVLATFDVARARDYKHYLPGMLDNPELQADLPVSFVVFDGPVQITVAGPAPPSDDEAAMDAASTSGFPTRTYTGVVCAIIGDVPIVYVDVDTTGYRVP
jgi:hypothetical protein